MKGDFNRVPMQQGRVQLDADWNEQAAILLHYSQALAADLIGPFGGPDPGCGFTLAAKDTDFTIGTGHSTWMAGCAKSMAMGGVISTSPIIHCLPTISCLLKPCSLIWTCGSGTSRRWKKV